MVRSSRREDRHWNNCFDLSTVDFVDQHFDCVRTGVLLTGHNYQVVRDLYRQLVDVDCVNVRDAFAVVERVVTDAVSESGSLRAYIVERRQGRVLTIIGSLYPNDLSVGELASRFAGLRKQLERCARDKWLS